ncbi:MAG: DAK2 domain protein [Firmicutes bacterium ADurb.Bin182]|nr:MAG: DAK2 domain protein [Firmicutes bacterium ADurb.Bin182]
MGDLTISGAMFKDMIYTGAALLEKNKALIDSLNVFPVPDGDTGTNMSMTMQSAVKEVKNSQAVTVSEIANALSLGSLKGARGNSGVILSQLFRGFARALSGAEELTAKDLAEALTKGTEAAYKAVMKPKEGTMLTVSRLISDAVNAAQAEGANVYKLIDIMIESGDAALVITPDLLPVLKEAGVVDSGGKGLLSIYRGFKMAIDGDEIDDYSEEAEAAATEEDNISFEDINDIKFAYCTEFFITHLDDSFVEEDLEKLREKLARIGDSVVVAHDAGIVKVHVHSNSPGKTLQLALRLGEIDKVKIENMLEQNRELQENLKKNEKEYALIAVSSGEGIDNVFTELSVNCLIQGGQTMNPSIESISRAIRKVNARNVFVFPNNPNIIMAAQQAAELSDRNVIVIPTKTIVQGISAVMAFNPSASVSDNKKHMHEAFESVLSGAVTYAVRKSKYNGTHINEGDIIGLMDGDIVLSGSSVEGISSALLRKMISEKSPDCIVTVFYGENMDEENANALVRELENDFKDAEFIVQFGGQPLYYYYFSVE